MIDFRLSEAYVASVTESQPPVVERQEPETQVSELYVSSVHAGTVPTVTRRVPETQVSELYVISVNAFNGYPLTELQAPQRLGFLSSSIIS